MSVEKRRHLRYPRQLHVEVLTYARQLEVNIDGLQTYTTNVSLEGLQIECPVMRLFGFETAVKDERVKLKIKIPDGDLVQALARVRYRSPYDGDYLIGLYLAAFAKDDGRRWQRYIASLEGTRSAD